VKIGQGLDEGLVHLKTRSQEFKVFQAARPEICFQCFVNILSATRVQLINTLQR
jgi:hypothetical protein